MNPRLIWMLCCWLGACTVAPVPTLPDSYFHDDWFASRPAGVSEGDIFAPSPAMLNYLDAEKPHTFAGELHKGSLVDLLRQQGRLKLDYDASFTRTAAQAFDAGKGNCLSLVIMTASLAKVLGLKVTYQAVTDVRTWSHNDDLLILSSHVNITISPRAPGKKSILGNGESLTIDFQPSEDAEGEISREISESTVVAMYLNNRAAEALLKGQVDEAYWWARLAIARSPAHTPALNTLGVIYLRHGNLDAATQVFRHLADNDSQDALAISNLIIVLDRTGHASEAQPWRDLLARLEAEPPYHFFLLGLDAYKHEDYRSARKLFLRELARIPYAGECHFWLGMTDLQLGNAAEAQRQIAMALNASTSDTERARYAAALEKLKARGGT